MVCPNGAAPFSPGLPRSGYPGTADAHTTFNPNGVAPFSPGLRRSRYPGTADAHATFNPNGVAPFSPGLRRSRYPGTADAHATFNPNGVAARSMVNDTTLSGLNCSIDPLSQGSRCAATLGWRT